MIEYLITRFPILWLYDVMVFVSFSHFYLGRTARSNSEDTIQTSLYASSALGMHCYQVIMSHEKAPDV